MFRNLFKNYKVKRFIFVFTLLVASTRIAQAGDFSSSLTYLSQMAQQVAAKHWDKIVPILGVCALVGIGTLWYKGLKEDKKNEDCGIGLWVIRSIIPSESEKGIGYYAYSRKYSDIEQAELGKEATGNHVVQLEVLRQGSDASCGYHALKNARIVIDHFEKLRVIPSQELQENLQDPTTVEELFGKEGSWRNKIRTGRAKQAMRMHIFNDLKKIKKIESKPLGFAALYQDTINYFIHRQIKQAADRGVKVCFADGIELSVTIKLSNIVSKLDTALDAYAINLAHQAMQDEDVLVNKESLKEFLQRYDFANFDSRNKETYIQSVLDQCEEDIFYSFDDCVCINNAIKKFMQKSNVLERYLDFNKLKERTYSFEKTDGDWLYDVEIQSLITSDNRHLPVTIIQDCTILGLNTQPDSNTQEDVLYKEEFKEIAQKIQDSKDGYVHAFILGTMTQQHASGHWYTLVVYAKENKLSYYVMDSLGINRVNDPNVARVIAELEKAVGV